MREMEMTKRHSSARTVVLFACISVLIIGLFACDDRKDSSSAHSGKLRLSLAADTTSLKKGVNSNLTKAVSDEFEKFLTVEDYQIRIVTDKDTVKSYDRFDKMPSEIELPEGAYTIVASKGNDLPAAFENPYFEGSTAFTIKEGMSTPLDMTCTLGNVRITAEYTDDFKEAYSDYTALLSSTFATTEFEIAKGETRPAYMQVAKEGTDVAIGIRLKKINAEEEKTYYVPTALKLERRQNVRLVFKTDGEALDGIGLDIVLDDTMEEVALTTKIPDFMWQQVSKPTLSAAGFENGASIEIKTSVFDDELQVGFNIPGGVKSFSVKRWIGDEEEEDAESLDLVTQADEALKQGYCWMVGETENGSLSNARAGYISLLKAIRSLQADPDNPVTYHFVFQAVDATGKAYESNTIRLTVVVQPAGAPFIDEQALALPSEAVEGDELVDVLQASLIAEGLIDEEHTTLTLTSSAGLNEVFRLTNDDERKKLYEGYGIGVEKIADSRLELYVFKSFTTFLTAPKEGGSTTYSLKLHLQDKNGKTDEVTKEIVVKAPNFELVTGNGDAFAKRIVLRTNFLGNENKNKLTYQYLNGSDWTDLPNQSLKKDASGTQWVDTLRNLTPKTKYSVRAIYNRGKVYERISKEVTVETETTGTIPNGGFEGSWYSRTISKMLNGANIIASRVSLTANDPESWATVNVKTFAEESNVNSTYNRVPSTMKYAEGYSGTAVRLRTVGWDNGAGNTVSICRHAAAGKLFLGSYAYDHNANTDTYDYGISFNSRPSYVKAYYKYTPVKGDSFKAWAVVLNREGERESVLGMGELVKGESVTDWEEMCFKINYTNYEKKATHIYVVFSSSSKCSEREDVETDNLKPYLNLGTEVDGYTHHEGSNLYIDNVELIYE